MIAELFEVKTGDNKGIYLKVDNKISKETQMELVSGRLQAGYINSNNVNFYRRHGACNKKTLQSLNTFDQLATIWRINSYGVGNQSTLEFYGDRIKEVIVLLEKKYIQELFKSA